MYLSGAFIGYSSFMSPQQPPLSVQYNKVTINGSGIFDKLHVVAIEMDLSELLAVDITDTISWDIDTIMIAEFNEDLSAGNINLSSPITGWDIYRQEEGSPNLVKLASVSNESEFYLDYTVPNLNTYTYIVFAITATEISEPLTASPLLVDLYSYYIIDDVTGTSYAFNLNVTSGNYETQQDLTIYDTFNRYPTFSQGSRKYETHSISALCGIVNCDGTFTQSVSYVKILRDFILNGRSKIFKNRKGDVYRAYTSDFSYTVLNLSLIHISQGIVR